MVLKIENKMCKRQARGDINKKMIKIQIKRLELAQCRKSKYIEGSVHYATKISLL